MHGGGATPHNRAVTSTAAVEPVSPELVLVSPPELAAQARTLLSEYPPFRPVPRPTRTSVGFGLGFAVFCLVCLAGTLLPFALAAFAPR